MHEPDHPTDTNTELAKSRTLFAANRTQMAWIRTSLSLISFGFGIPTIVKAIESTRLRNDLDPHRFASILGLAFIAVGMFAMAASLMEHRHLLQRIQKANYTYESSKTTDLVSVALFLIGVMSFIGVLLKTLRL